MKRSILVVIVALAVVLTASANLMLNPGFETAEGGSGMWGRTPLNYWGGNAASSEGWAGRTGTNGVAFWSWDNGTYAYFGQDVSTNMILGDVITFSIFARAEADFRSSSLETRIELEVWTNGGAASYTARVTNDVYSALIGSPGVWNQYTIMYTNQFSGMTVVKPVISGGGFTNRGGSQAVTWDDSDMTVVIPEPTIAALMGFGGLLFLAVRRMTRK
jgi:hypothetical protein